MSNVPKQRVGTPVWGVHLARRDATGHLIVGPTILVSTSQSLAEQQAFERSKDDGVRGASVTRYRLDRVGEDTRESLWVEGVRQQVPFVTDGSNPTYILG